MTDAIDQLLINALMEDSRRSLKALAQVSGLSAPSVSGPERSATAAIAVPKHLNKGPPKAYPIRHGITWVRQQASCGARPRMRFTPASISPIKIQ